jgi:hypothetical protein
MGRGGSCKKEKEEEEARLKEREGAGGKISNAKKKREEKTWRDTVNKVERKGNQVMSDEGGKAGRLQKQF